MVRPYRSCVTALAYLQRTQQRPAVLRAKFHFNDGFVPIEDGQPPTTVVVDYGAGHCRRTAAARGSGSSSLTFRSSSTLLLRATAFSSCSARRSLARVEARAGDPADWIVVKQLAVRRVWGGALACNVAGNHGGPPSTASLPPRR
jgi:hypothetical protein